MRNSNQAPECRPVQGVGEDALLGEEGWQVGLDKIRALLPEPRCHVRPGGGHGPQRTDVVWLDSDAVPHASLGRVEAEPSSLEGMHFKAAVNLKVMHAARRGEDVCVIQERHCILVGAKVGLQIAKGGSKRQRESLALQIPPSSPPSSQQSTHTQTTGIPEPPKRQEGRGLRHCS